MAAMPLLPGFPIEGFLFNIACFYAHAAPVAVLGHLRCASRLAGNG